MPYIPRQERRCRIMAGFVRGVDFESIRRAMKGVFRKVLSTAKVAMGFMDVTCGAVALGEERPRGGVKECWDSQPRFR